MADHSYELLVKEFHELRSKNSFDLVGGEDFSRVDELPDISAPAVERHASACASLADKIDQAETSGLPLPQQLDLEMAANELRAVAHQDMVPTGGYIFSHSPRHTVCPHALQDFLGLTPIYLDRDLRGKDEIVRSVIQRLRMLGPFLSDQLAKLDHPVGFMAEREIETGKGFHEVVTGVFEFARGGDHLVSQPLLSTLESAIPDAIATVNRYLANLEAMPKRTSYSMGPEATAKWFRYKGITLSMSDIHQLAGDHMKRTMDELTAMNAELVRKYSLSQDATVLDVAAALKVRFASPKEGVVALAQEMYCRARDFANSSGLVIPLSDAVMEVRSCPSYLHASIPIAAVYTPGSFGIGPKRSTFYIHEFDGIETSLNRLNLPAITAHELYPGHGYQLGRAREHHSLVRRWLRPMELAEGWTTYVAEEVMTAKGFRGNPDLGLEEEFMAKMDILRLGARVCFVLAGMTGDRDYLDNNQLGITVENQDLFSAAVEFYTKVTGFSHARAYGDVQLFSSIDTYGALYLVGNHGFRQIEEAARQQQGRSFSRPALLERILQEGNLPLACIQRQLEHDNVISPRLPA